MNDSLNSCMSFTGWLILHNIEFEIDDDGDVFVNDDDLIPYHDEVKFLFPDFEFLYELN